MEKKLTSFVQSNSYKIVELYNKLDSGTLITDPEFQRNLVWKKQHKYNFIQTILLNYPFPEVYIASEQIDVENLKAKEIVVDGQQRLTTIVEYIKGIGDFDGVIPITKFDDLSLEDKKAFLNYPVSVKDLKDLDMDTIKQIFQRINSTNYALNSNEKLNAEYGGGEFAYFAKQLTSLDFVVESTYTDVVIDEDVRNEIITFFKDYNVFTDNDIKRMFDSQFIMLLAATILDGDYFGRNSKIKHYLETYNEEFANYDIPLEKLSNSINIIKRLGLDEKSYWLNKANLFTLLIELRDIDLEKIDYTIFETQLWELERKFDLYFNASSEEELEGIIDDEKKYFEYARQGSHELQARKHRGEVIRRIIQKSLVTEKEEKKGESIEERVKQFIPNIADFAVIIPTETGLKKSIMDATLKVREFLKQNKIHDYEIQENGPDHKVVTKGKLVKEENAIDTDISMYKSNGRGDCRIWFSGLTDFAEPNKELIITEEDGVIKVYSLKDN